MNRFFTARALHADTVIDLEPAIQKHAIQVLRLSEGDQLELVGPEALPHLATILTAAPLRVQVGAALTRRTELPVAVHLICGIPKGEKAELIVQKATELGAAAISFFNSQWATAKWAPNRVVKKLERFQAIAQGAAEQSHRSVVPSIDVVTLNEMTKLHADARLIAYEESAKAGETAALVAAMARRPQSLIAVFGPEGGLSPVEVSTLQSAGYVPVGLGPRILRTETAPLYLLSAVSVLSELQGD
ncbi:RsmE family RNA methyltransferase [Lacticaseibacillus camelliae]|uniref:Ribosomal RNA small subunit methyltransferase E n=1 Tax=Lacticaseibacillus camelliae DSM 22697 = JCM 13995 TaxID=1423730 RepID=A0A0R2F1Q8_9LACO|nr:16S rRNA (uracil(1498)-N(3))-methyltransferase [Lacticaseibacillus camelliae]KRN22211.1 RNA methyltransferase [Lacticaseibacillus camelliae DSM 22697 = JCM 13995]